jgi:hypothetical protein
MIDEIPIIGVTEWTVDGKREKKLDFWISEVCAIAFCWDEFPVV